MESAMHLVDSYGEFNKNGMDDFVQRNQLPGEVVVVTIIGPQSSGKSTLLNRLFFTNFTEMDQSKGRRQTTQGLWLAKAGRVMPCTLLMDCEGSDGAERGEDDTLFERQAALFALAVSDIMLINLWYHDVGREKAACRPLLKIVFEVMVRRRLFRRKITLMLVIRDVSRYTLEYPESSQRLESDLVKSLEDIWKTVEMPSDLEGAPLQKFFNLKVTLLSSLEDRPVEFEEQVAKLRNDFQDSTESGGLADDRSENVPGTAFSHHFKSLWQKVKENKDLDLPSHRVMVATVRCDQIIKEELDELESDAELSTLFQNASKGVIEGFGEKVSALVNKYLKKFVVETEYLDENIKNCKWESFVSEIRKLVQPSLSHQVKNLQVQVFNGFKSRIDDIIKSSKLVEDNLPYACKEALDAFNRGREDAYFEWDPKMGGDEFSNASTQLSKDMSAYEQGRREAKESELIFSSQRVLKDRLSIGIGDVLAEAGKSTTDTWFYIREQVKTAVEEELSRCTRKFKENFNPTEKEMRGMRKSLEECGQAAAKKRVKEGILRLPDMLIDRFRSILTHNPCNAGL